MIVRIYRCTVAAGKEAAIREFGFSTGHPWLRDKPRLGSRSNILDAPLPPLWGKAGWGVPPHHCR
jgi:hypothetical protein